MNAETKAKWCAALRSGDYEQAKSQLRSDTGFCCLGVLCDVAIEGKWKRDKKWPDWYFYPSETISSGRLLESLGQEEIDILGLTLHTTRTVTRMNDGTMQFKGIQKSFNEIADWIEANVHEG